MGLEETPKVGDVCDHSYIPAGSSDFTQATSMGGTPLSKMMPLVGPDTIDGAIGGPPPTYAGDMYSINDLSGIPEAGYSAQLQTAIDEMIAADPDFAQSLHELKAAGYTMEFTIRTLNQGETPPPGSFSFQDSMRSGGSAMGDQLTNGYKLGQFNVDTYGIDIDPAAFFDPETLKHTIAHEVAHAHMAEFQPMLALDDHHGEDMDILIQSYLDGQPTQQNPATL